MSDLGRLFRLSLSQPKPLENFATVALAIAINHDARPIIEALKRVDRSGHDGISFPVLDLLGSPFAGMPVKAEVQSTLFSTGESRIGFLDLVLRTRDRTGSEAAVWVEVKVDAWESSDQISVYLKHAKPLVPKPDIITLGRTRVSELVPFLEWSSVVQAVESVSNPHYTWVSLREFLLEEKIVRPTVRSLPADAEACIDLIVAVNGHIRELWPDAGLAWADHALRKDLRKAVDRELLAVGGPVIYGLALIDGVWQWCLRLTVEKNYERIRLEAHEILRRAEALPADWTKDANHPELLERRLSPGQLMSHDHIVRWFDEGLRQLRDAGVLDSYLAGINEKRAKASAKQRNPGTASGPSEEPS